jgi:AmiR/NasT family two-component response regulator
MAAKEPAVSAPLRVAVADDERDIREYLQEALTRLGWKVTVAAATGRELVSACQAAPPDLIITDIKLPDLDGIEAARQANAAGPVPVILVSAHHTDDLLARLSDLPVLGYLVKPITEANLKAAVAVAVTRFRHFEALRQEAADLRQALDDRKLIERAKGALMRRLGVDEDEAFRRLRSAASGKNLKLAEMARQIMAAESVFAELSG